MMITCRWICCLSRLHLKKMTEFLSNTYSMACVRRARSHYTRLLWSFSNFPKLRWPLLSAKPDWLEWFSLEKLCCCFSYTKAKAHKNSPVEVSGHANLFKSLHKGLISVRFVTFIISHVFPLWFSDITLRCTTLNRISVVSKVSNLLNRFSFLQSAAVKCGHIGDFDAFSMFSAEDSLRDLCSLSGLNPGPPSPCLSLSKIQNLGCENHLDVKGNPSLDWQENGLE